MGEIAAQASAIRVGGRRRPAVVERRVVPRRVGEVVWTGGSARRGPDPCNQSVEEVA
jgi:hypothetical protein